MKISKRTREQAALLCSMAACAEVASLIGASDRAGISPLSRVFTLAWNAYMESPAASQPRATYAEAESLLRTGWSP